MAKITTQWKAGSVPDDEALAQLGKASGLSGKLASEGDGIYRFVDDKGVATGPGMSARQVLEKTVGDNAFMSNHIGQIKQQAYARAARYNPAYAEKMFADIESAEQKAYSRGRDAVGDTRDARNFNRLLERDAVGDAHFNANYGLAASANSRANDAHVAGASSRKLQQLTADAQIGLADAVTNYNLNPTPENKKAVEIAQGRMEGMRKAGTSKNPTTQSVQKGGDGFYYIFPREGDPIKTSVRVAETDPTKLLPLFAPEPGTAEEKFERAKALASGTATAPPPSSTGYKVKVSYMGNDAYVEGANGEAVRAPQYDKK
jgi:hypothetical protein